ncbi:MAG: chemotaxis response regulator protein-glutamate methylesterase [Bacteroidetes bacterium 4572_77]|nr:MAG: chemotaxis response regulator protein-glutamate methylesterase [Bacteroidetes bacterium 4572_77]
MTPPLKTFIYPGKLSASRIPYHFSTILGSCIAVCLWDTEKKIGGMNHYMLPFWNGEGLSSPKYGNIAIEKLIRKMLLLGCNKKDLKAKIFGGASVINSSQGLYNIGERNIQIVDDSISIRNVMESYISSDPQIEVVGKAADPYEAAQIIKQQIPDVITLDIEMPKMDGLTFLKKIMSQHPIPVIIVSSLSHKGAETSIKAMEFGAVEILQKPIKYGETTQETISFLVNKIKTAYNARLKARSPRKMIIQPKLSADAILKKSRTQAQNFSSKKLIAIGASTGGTEALLDLLKPLDSQCTGIVVVQHMPAFFTGAFANRLNQTCSIFVKEAEDGDVVKQGQVLIAPGDKHLSVRKINSNFQVKLIDGPPVNRHRPSVDVLFRSVANMVGRQSLGILLTGMGDDGAHGLLELKETGAQTIAQDEKSCVVYGMPKEAVKLGAVKYQLNIKAISQYIKQFK